MLCALSASLTSLPDPTIDQVSGATDALNTSYSFDSAEKSHGQGDHDPKKRKEIVSTYVKVVIKKNATTRFRAPVKYATRNEEKKHGKMQTRFIMQKQRSNARQTPATQHALFCSLGFRAHLNIHWQWHESTGSLRRSISRLLCAVAVVLARYCE